MRIVSMIGVALAGLLLSSCASSTSNFIADTLPEWAGGLPPDAPPRPGAPGYRAYLRQIDGDETAKAAPAAPAQTKAGPAPPAQTTAAANPPPNQPHESIDQPIH